jgi:PKD repeat protein
MHPRDASEEAFKMRFVSLHHMGSAALAVLAAACLLAFSVGQASADTITFSNITSGGLSSQSATFTGGWRWQSLYGTSGPHMHSGSGNPSPGLSIHTSCCSTPYRMDRPDGQPFTLTSIWGSGASGTLTSSAGGSQGLSGGNNSFSGSQWTNVIWIEWAAGGGSIDNVVVSSCNPVASLSIGGPYSVTEGSSIQLEGTGSGVTSWAWDLDGDGTYETSGREVTFSAASYDGPSNHSVVVQGSNVCSSTVATGTVAVNNAPPVITTVNGANSAEGVPIAFSVTATDPGNDTLTYVWNFGDGVSITGASHSYAYAVEGTYTVTVTADDGDGGTATDTTTVTIVNGDPVISNLVGDSSGAEGATLSWTVIASDAGGDTLSYNWDFGDGSTPLTNSPTPFTSHTYSNEGSYQLTVTVTDGDGGSALSILTVTVSNAIPSVSNLTGTASGVEGDTYSYTVTATDPGSGDVLSYRWDFGDGTPPLVTATGSATHVFADSGTFGVTVTVSDNASPPGSDDATMLVAVSNLPPILSVVVAPGGNEGDTLSYSAAATDPGADILVFTWTMGDGTTLVGANVTHSYDDEGSYPLGLTVTDGDGGSDTSSATIVIVNVSPTITSATVPSGEEGVNLIFSGTATDPGNDTLTYTWDFGDGSSDVGALVSHTFSDNGTYTVTLTVSDGDGGSDSTTSSSTIGNVAPVIDTLTGPSTVDEGDPVAFSATSIDPSSDDLANMVYTWSWGDGTSDSTGASVTHAFPDDGSYTVLLTIDDGDAVATQTHSVTANNVAPQFTSSPAATAEEGVLYTYLPVVDDPGDEVFVWSLSASAPATMAMNPATGELSWTPDYADSLTGTFAVTLSVDDGDGATDVQTWTIDVTFSDADGDGLSDSWEINNGLDPTDASDALADPDADGLDNAAEYSAGQDPNSFDGPSAPVPVSPLTDEEAIEATPDLIVTNAVDPQGEVLVYEFEIYADPNLLVSVSGSGWVAEDVAETFWKVDVPLAENGIYWWRARAADPYVEGPWNDVQEFMVNLENDAPGVPVAVYPLAGQVVAQVVPSMEWAPAVDIDGDDLSYTVRIYAADLETLVAEGSAVVVLEGEVNGSWDVDVALEEDSSYAWTVMATDEHGLDGGWSAAETFLYTLANGAPEGVELISPEDGSSIPDRSPTLVASEGSDPEGEEMTYVFEVDAVASFDGEDFATATVDASGTGEVEWDLDDDDIELPQNTVVYARVWAMDADGVSSAPHTISFEVRGENDPPPVPELLFPADGATAESVTPVLEASQVEDPEGDLVFYDFVVARDVELTDIVAGGEGLGLLGGTGPLGTEGATSWQVDSNLNGALYWSARSVDEFGEASEWAVAFALVVEGGEPEVSLPQEVLGGGALAGCSCASSVAGRLPLRGLALLLLLLAPLAVRRRRR